MPSSKSLQRKRRVELTPELLLSFSQLYLSRNYDDAVAHPKCHLEWWYYCCLPRKFVALAAPRGHAKSTAITHVFVLANVCFRIKKHVLILSDTEGQAAMFLGNIRNELIENEDLRKTFGIKALLKDAETEIIVQFTDGHKCRIFARGAGQRIRGVNWLGIRPDLVVGDDLENDEAVMNEDRREKFRNWVLTALVPAGGTGCTYRVVGTILHEDSFLNRIMPRPIEDVNCVIEPLKIWTTTKGSWLSVLYRAHPDFDDFSQMLWPERHSESSLRLIRQAYIDDGYPEGYSQEYLNDPVASSAAYFVEDDLKPIPVFEKDATTKQAENFYIGVDLAISKESRRAYTAFVIAGLAADGVLRVREVIRQRMDTLEIIDTFFLLYQKYRRYSQLGSEPVFLVEDENIRKSIGPVLNKAMEESGLYLTIEKMPPIGDKRLRARSIQARIRQHMVEFDHEAGWWPTFKHEMLLFDKGTYADQVDALAWIGYQIANMDEGPEWEDVAEAEYEDELEQAYGTAYTLPDRWTGYA